MAGDEVNWYEVQLFLGAPQVRNAVGKLSIAEFECEISPGYDVDKKVMAFDNWHKRCLSSPAWDHPQKV